MATPYHNLISYEAWHAVLASCNNMLLLQHVCRPRYTKENDIDCTRMSTFPLGQIRCCRLALYGFDNVQLPTHPRVGGG
eukprot:13534029-Heterocapsa_arctica.AAC.1